jgi:hypothetical protein
MKSFALLALMGSSVFAATPSPNDTVVMAGSGQLITDTAGNLWGISPAALVTENSTADKTTGAVTELAYVSGVVWQKNTAGDWYSKTATSWSAATTVSPLPASVPTQAVLNWTAPATDTNGAPISVPLTYNVYRGLNATSMAKLTNVSGLSYIDPAGSTSPTTYFYAVTAVQAGHEGAQSNVVSGTIAAPTLTPTAPTLAVK